MDIGYKSNLKNPNSLQQYRVNELDEAKEYDLADGKIDEIHFEIDFLEGTIENAKEYFKNSMYDDLLKILIYWYNSIKDYKNYFTKSFLRKTDFCKLLIEVASNKNNIEVQFYAFYVIAFLIDISIDSIDEFIDLYGMNLFAQISYNQKTNVLLLGYSILCKCLNTPKGVNAFLSENVAFNLIDTFDTFLQRQRPELSKDYLDCIQQIYCIFKKLLKHINHDNFPKELPRLILDVFLHAINANYNQFYVDSVEAATLIVSQLNDDGNQLIIDTKFLDHIISELNSIQESRLNPLLDLLIQIFSQKNKEKKIKLLGKIPQELLIKQFLHADINSVTYIKIMNLLCNCFICGLYYSWILESQSINKIKSVFEEGSFLSKEATSKCIMIAVFVANPNDCEKLINLQILVSAIQSISSLSDKANIIKMLQILNKMLETICRNNLQFNADNEIVDVLQDLNSIDDPKISELIDYIMKSFYPEIYYDRA